jgi:hypothetical protein
MIVFVHEERGKRRRSKKEENVIVNIYKHEATVLPLRAGGHQM